MPSKKKKYNARFPAGRIKKIMQTDEEVGKVAQAVPVIISRTLELFVESLLTKSMQITQARCAKTLTPSHMKQCILSESRFDFLKDLVKEIPDPSTQEDNENNAKEADYVQSKLVEQATRYSDSRIPSGCSSNLYTEQSTSSGRTPVIKYGPTVTQLEQYKSSNPVDTLDNKNWNTDGEDSKCHTGLSRLSESSSVDGFPASSHLVPNACRRQHSANSTFVKTEALQDTKGNIPPLIPISRKDMYEHNSGDNLYIDEDYDN